MWMLSNFFTLHMSGVIFYGYTFPVNKIRILEASKYGRPLSKYSVNKHH